MRVLANIIGVVVGFLVAFLVGLVWYESARANRMKTAAATANRWKEKKTENGAAPNPDIEVETTAHFKQEEQ